MPSILSIIAGCFGQSTTTEHHMKFLKNLLFFLFLLLITLAAAELVCRAFGLKPYRENPVKFDYKPTLPGRYDSIMGHVLLPGYFSITKNDTFTYHATHDSLGRRISKPSDEIADYTNSNKVIILGCSFTYGDCLEDSQTHAYLLQQLFRKNDLHLSVENWGVGGYCPSHFYLLSKNILKDTSVKYVVINYSRIHNERTICGRNWRKSLVKYTNQRKYQKTLNVPYFALENETPVLKYKPLEYHFLPFQKDLALVEYIDQLYCKFETRNAAAITKKVLQLTIDSLQQKGIHVILTSITGDEESNAMVHSMAKSGYNTLLYGINTGEDRYNFNPIDGHPNYRANKIFADSLYSRITSLQNTVR